MKTITKKVIINNNLENIITELQEKKIIIYIIILNLIINIKFGPLTFY